MTNSINTFAEYDAISAFLKSQAIDFLNADAAVYLEGEEDEHFWRNALKHAKPNKEYEFYYNSNLLAVEKEEHRSGSGECVKFYPHTNTQFIVCVDSDYNYLLDSHTFSTTNTVFQAYTYSIENHYCFATNLQDIILHLTGQSTFDFNVFLTAYSEIVYELFVLSVLSEKKEDGLFSISDFQKTGKISDYPDLSNNGKNELNQLQTNVNAKLSSLKGIYTTREIEEVKQVLAKKGLTSQTTYLFIKGQALIDLDAKNIVKRKVINNINNKILDQHRKVTKSAGASQQEYVEHLHTTLTHTGYWQMEKLIDDMRRKL